ncbi:hypothetical protein [Umezawaea sp. Da 62-37]|uniref:hypothetical protein n=1 Tax=Umezawaea sp. Da 62-37 TaxID=3075927 RepID=UPI0028F700ED|nr:hypothetical protein [Umezawaea sp. Da 62-37]WNV87082.1 hypothetical protein RM788_01965 [Umezawaea sp. Da 62-37]
MEPRPTKPGWTAAHVALVVVSVVLTLVPVGLLLYGVVLVLRDFFSWGGLLGVVLVVLAYVLRPRLGRTPARGRVLRREQASTLFALVDRIASLLVHHAETRPASRWAAMAESTHEATRDELPALRQLSLRRTDLWGSHPPLGLRARMAEAWPSQDPRFVLADADSARIDVELTAWYDAAHREFLGARDYRGPRG